MTPPDENDNQMRKRAEWMMYADDLILEVLRDLRASSPKEISEHLDYSREHISRRLSKLAEYGLIDKPSRGLYRINEKGEKYLDEELDASNLEPRDLD